jgi:hypothetical protein
MAAPRKKRATVIAAKPYPVGGGTASMVRESAGDTVGQELARRVRAAGAYTVGDQTPPAAILWPDGERRWDGVLSDLKALIPELYSLGAIAPEERTGPAIWPRCIEARTAEPAPPTGRTPIFYLPGVSRQDLRAVEECPSELEPLVELQFRGAVWSHPNGRDWTPIAFLTSAHGGLSLEVLGDPDTAAALDRSLAEVLKERLADLAGEKLDAQFLNRLLAPDPPVEILRWMNDPAAARKRKGDFEWQAFCAQCVADYRLHPEKDGELRAAELMGNRTGEWGKVWKRFAEAPSRYPGVVVLLERAAPATDGLLALDREYWPTNNARDEAALAKALLGLKDTRAAEAAKAILELERMHGCRRQWVWREVGRAPLAVALEHLSLLATLTPKALAAADAAGMAEQYVQSGWETDGAAMAALAAGNTPETDDAVATAVRALYLPWVDASARNLQHFALQSPTSMTPRLGPAEATDGRVLLFVDGLRFDLAHRLARHLKPMGIQPQVEWDWAAFPTVTPTGKAAVSPMASVLTGGGPEEEFAPSVATTGQRWTSDRFLAFLKEQGVQNLQGRDCGQTSGRAWAEVGSLDSRGHNEGVKTAKTLDQGVRDIASRIQELLDAGWREIVVVTDHGWLLVPGGLPKVALSHFIVEHRWGRCAAMKTTGITDLPMLPWHWNPGVTIATPPGAGCFRAGLEYTHGGVSAQESVVPRLTIRAGMTASGQARISAVKWVGLRCRVSVQHAMPGMKADVRGRPADARSSKIEGGQPREIGSDGTVSLPVGDDRETGNAAVIVLLGPDGTPAQTVPTVIGENP